MDRFLSMLWIPIAAFILAASCNNLKRGEIAKISYDCTGCFGSSKSTITFFKNNKGLHARLKEDDKDKIVPVSDSVLKDVNAVITSIRSLKRLNGCTNTVHYTVYTTSEIIDIEDRGCQQTGFENLLKIFEDAN